MLEHLKVSDYGTPRRVSAQDVTLEIDGEQVTVPVGTSLMRAAVDAGIQVPKLCATDTLEPFGSCRLCLVEIEGRKGTRPRARPRAARTWLSRPARLGC